MKEVKSLIQRAKSEAILLTKGLSFSSHKGVISAT